MVINLGEIITKVDDRVFIYSEEGKLYGKYSHIQDPINTRMITSFVNKDTELIYKNEILTTFDEFKKKLGSNYIDGLTNLGRNDTITYVDQSNNIELIFQGNKDIMIYLKRIEDNHFRISATPILNGYGGFGFIPFNVILSLMYRLKSNYVFNPKDYFQIPIYLSILLLPMILLISKMGKLIRKKIVVQDADPTRPFLLWKKSNLTRATDECETKSASNISKYSCIMSSTLIVCFISNVIAAILFGGWVSENALFYLFVMQTVLGTVIINLIGAILGALAVFKNKENTKLPKLGLILNISSLIIIILSFPKLTYILAVFKVLDMIKHF